VKKRGGFIELVDVHGDTWLVNVDHIKAAIPTPDRNTVQLLLSGGGGGVLMSCEYGWLIASLRDAGCEVVASS
jgi:hypothetical protein